MVWPLLPAGAVAPTLPTDLIDQLTGVPELTQEKAVFCIGQDKTGTESLTTIFEEMPGHFNPCHDLCEPERKRWWVQSEMRMADWPGWNNHRAFMDNGDLADFIWINDFLSARNAPPRFVLNTRALVGWVLSRYDMTADNRERAGCSREGDKNDCPWGKNKNGSPTEMVNNSPDYVLREILEESRSQEVIKKYFKESPERMNRYVAVDLLDKPEDTLIRLLWVSRHNASAQARYAVQGLPSVDYKFDDETWAHYSGLLKRSNLTVPLKNINSHSRASIEAVNKILVDGGCSGMFSHVHYRECASAIRRMRNLTVPKPLPWLKDTPSGRPAIDPSWEPPSSSSPKALGARVRVVLQPSPAPWSADVQTHNRSRVD